MLAELMDSSWKFVSPTVVEAETRTIPNVSGCRYDAGQTSWTASGVYVVHQDAKFVRYAIRNRRPVNVLQYQRLVITRAQTANESGSCILSLLQRLQCCDGRFWLSGQNCVALFKFARNERQYEIGNYS
jgi:hypothetical protein